MTPVRIGIVGAGGITRNMHLPVLMSMPRVSVEWITDTVALRAVELARAYRVPRGLGVSAPADLPDADVVLLAIPPKPRAAYYQHLAARNCAVFAEKPFALSVADHVRFNGLFGPGRIGCGYMRRFFANNVLLKRIVAQQWFGPLCAITVAEGGRTTKTGVESTYLDLPSSAGGGIIHDYACHTLDLLFELTGATQAHVVSRDVVFDGQTDRRVHATLQVIPASHSAPVEVDYTCSWLDNQPNSVVLSFANVSIETGTSAGAPVVIRAGGSEPSASISADQGATTINQAFYLQWTEFLDGFAAGRDSRVSAASCLPVTRVVDELLGLPIETEVAV